MKAMRTVFILVGVAVLTVLIAALVKSTPGSFLRENIVNPLSYGFWVFGLLLSGTPQAVFWVFLLVVALVLALRSLSGSAQKPTRPEPLIINYTHRARARYWVRQLLLSRDERARLHLKDSLSRLALDILAYQQGLTPNQYQKQLEDGQMEAPEALIPFLNVRQSMYTSRQSLSLEQVRRWFEHTINNLPFLSQPKPVQDAEIERLVSYLEEQMDVE